MAETCDVSQSPLFSQNFGYSPRGNRTNHGFFSASSGCDFPQVSGAGGREDLLLDKNGQQCGNSLVNHTWSYDRDGRRVGHGWYGNPGAETVGYGGSTGSLGDVYSNLTVPGGSFDYYYDALQRRRLKISANGGRDEYFYDLGNRLILDQGNPKLTEGSEFTVDEYVWLDDRPILLVRDNYANPDLTVMDPTDCARDEEEGTCGVFALISDHIKAPIASFDDKGQLTAYAHYNAFGQMNWLPTSAATGHPYANNQNVTLESVGLHLGSSESFDIRVLLHVLETQPGDYVYLLGQGTSGQMSGGLEVGTWSDWLRDQTGAVDLRFVSNGSGVANAGVSAEAFEFRRHQANTPWMFTPLRFPGQYFDRESLLHNNWNRYYDPGTGRYLQPEPLLQNPKYVADMAKAGLSTPVYGYANNNPLAFVDPDGRFLYSAFHYFKNLFELKEYFGLERKGSDKYHHCIANCEAAANDGLGWVVRQPFNFAKEEIFDRARQCTGGSTGPDPADWAANDYGGRAPEGANCHAWCSRRY